MGAFLLIAVLMAIDVAMTNAEDRACDEILRQRKSAVREYVIGM